MKKLGKLTVLTTKEYESLVCKCEDASAAADDFAEELSRAYAARDEAVASTRKWHAAGGYSHTLPKLKEELRQAQEQLCRYSPIAEIFQPSKELTTLLQDVNGVSDADAAADFEVVGNQARRARVKA